jgi:multidrug resistance efflux pump
MIAILVILYVTFAIVLFKVLRIRPTPYAIAGMLLLGVFMIGGVVVAWTQAAPITTKLVTSQYVVELVPYVKGQVTAVNAQANQPMKKGDTLLQIDPAPYQYTVDQLEAQMNSAKDSVKQAGAGLDAANANVQKAKDGVTQAEAAVQEARAAIETAQAARARTKAADDLAKIEEEMALELQRTGGDLAISRLNVAQATQKRLEADAAVEQASAAVAQAQAAEQQAVSGVATARSTVQQAEAGAQQASFAVQVAQSNVSAVAAQLDGARFDLAQCRMLAPADGYVANWTVQVGTMLAPSPGTAAGAFVDTSDTEVGAVFPQNWLSNVEPGDDVEMVLDPYPGRLFLGKVEFIIPATGGGQFAPGGTVVNAARVGSDGLYAVRIKFDDQAIASKLSLGSGGSAAIYTKRGQPTHIISKVTMRMKKWLLYILPSA